MSACTAKLDIGFAVQRLFLEDGREIFTDLEIATMPRDTNVYASSGEPFKRPLSAATRLPRAITRSVAWTSKGIKFPDSVPRGRTTGAHDPTSKPTDTFQKVLVFPNGDGRTSESRHVLLNKRKFLDLCSAGLGMSKPVTRIFMLTTKEMGTESGDPPFREVTATMAAFEKPFDYRLAPVMGDKICGPLWASTGSAMDKEGPARWLQAQHVEIKARVKAAKAAITAPPENKNDVTLQSNLDLVLVVSCSSSMGSQLTEFHKIQEVVKQAKVSTNASTVRVAVVGFRDVGCVAPLKHFERLNFSSDLAKVARFVKKLKATGVDGPVRRCDVVGALEQCSELMWKRGSTKCVLLATDTPAHGYAFDPDADGGESGALRELSGVETVTLRNTYGGTVRYAGGADIIPQLINSEVQIHALQVGESEENVSLMYEKFNEWADLPFNKALTEEDYNELAKKPSQKAAVSAAARWKKSTNTVKALNRMGLQQIGAKGGQKNNGGFSVQKVGRVRAARTGVIPRDGNELCTMMVKAIESSMEKTNKGELRAKLKELKECKAAIEEALERVEGDGWMPQYKEAEVAGASMFKGTAFTSKYFDGTGVASKKRIKYEAGNGNGHIKLAIVENGHIASDEGTVSILYSRLGVHTVDQEEGWHRLLNACDHTLPMSKGRVLRLFTRLPNSCGYSAVAEIKSIRRLNEIFNVDFSSQKDRMVGPVWLSAGEDFVAYDGTKKVMVATAFETGSTSVGGVPRITAPGTKSGMGPSNHQWKIFRCPASLMPEGFRYRSDAVCIGTRQNEYQMLSVIGQSGSKALSLDADSSHPTDICYVIHNGRHKSLPHYMHQVVGAIKDIQQTVKAICGVAPRIAVLNPKTGEKLDFTNKMTAVTRFINNIDAASGKHDPAEWLPQVLPKSGFSFQKEWGSLSWGATECKVVVGLGQAGTWENTMVDEIHPANITVKVFDGNTFGTMSIEGMGDAADVEGASEFVWKEKEVPGKDGVHLIGVEANGRVFVLAPESDVIVDGSLASLVEVNGWGPAMANELYHWRPDADEFDDGWCYLICDSNEELALSARVVGGHVGTVFTIENKKAPSKPGQVWMLPDPDEHVQLQSRMPPSYLAAKASGILFHAACLEAPASGGFGGSMGGDDDEHLDVLRSMFITEPSDEERRDKITHESIFADPTFENLAHAVAMSISQRNSLRTSALSVELRGIEHKGADGADRIVDSSQLWVFQEDGTIKSLLEDEQRGYSGGADTEAPPPRPLVLTYNNFVFEGRDGDHARFKHRYLVAERVGTRGLSKWQRWGLYRGMSFASSDNRVVLSGLTTAWNQQALNWPVVPGSTSTEGRALSPTSRAAADAGVWPATGNLIAGAPWVDSATAVLKKKLTRTTHVVKALEVLALKNGTRKRREGKRLVVPEAGRKAKASSVRCDVVLLHGCTPGSASYNAILPFYNELVRLNLSVYVPNITDDEMAEEDTLETLDFIKGSRFGTVAFVNGNFNSELCVKGWKYARMFGPRVLVAVTLDRIHNLTFGDSQSDVPISVYADFDKVPVHESKEFETQEFLVSEVLEYMNAVQPNALRMRALLSKCTEVLGMKRTAKRVFLKGGQELTHGLLSKLGQSAMEMPFIYLSAGKDYIPSQKERDAMEEIEGQLEGELSQLLVFHKLINRMQSATKPALQPVVNGKHCNLKMEDTPGMPEWRASREPSSYAAAADAGGAVTTLEGAPFEISAASSSKNSPHGVAFLDYSSPASAGADVSLKCRSGSSPVGKWERKAGKPFLYAAGTSPELVLTVSEATDGGPGLTLEEVRTIGNANQCWDLSLSGSTTSSSTLADGVVVTIDGGDSSGGRSCMMLDVINAKSNAGARLAGRHVIVLVYMEGGDSAFDEVVASTHALFAELKENNPEKVTFELVQATPDPNGTLGAEMAACFASPPSFGGGDGIVQLVVVTGKGAAWADAASSAAGFEEARKVAASLRDSNIFITPAFVGVAPAAGVADILSVGYDKSCAFESHSASDAASIAAGIRAAAMSAATLPHPIPFSATFSDDDTLACKRTFTGYLQVASASNKAAPGTVSGKAFVYLSAGPAAESSFQLVQKAIRESQSTSMPRLSLGKTDNCGVSFHARPLNESTEQLQIDAHGAFFKARQWAEGQQASQAGSVVAGQLESLQQFMGDDQSLLTLSAVVGTLLAAVRKCVASGKFDQELVTAVQQAQSGQSYRTLASDMKGRLQLTAYAAGDMAEDASPDDVAVTAALASGLQPRALFNESDSIMKKLPPLPMDVPALAAAGVRKENWSKHLQIGWPWKVPLEDRLSPDLLKHGQYFLAAWEAALYTLRRAPADLDDGSRKRYNQDGRDVSNVDENARARFGGLIRINGVSKSIEAQLVMEPKRRKAVPGAPEDRLVVFLDQVSGVMGLTVPARALFTEDGQKVKLVAGEIVVPVTIAEQKRQAAAAAGAGKGGSTGGSSTLGIKSQKAMPGAGARTATLERKFPTLWVGCGERFKAPGFHGVRQERTDPTTSCSAAIRNMAQPTRAVTRIWVRWNGALPAIVTPVVAKGTDLLTLIEACTANLPSRGRPVKLLYAEDGSPVKSMLDVVQDGTMWASLGEPFRQPGQKAMTGGVGSATAEAVIDLLVHVPRINDDSGQEEFADHKDWLFSFLNSAPSAALQDFVVQATRLQVVPGEEGAIKFTSDPDCPGVKFASAERMVYLPGVGTEEELHKALNDALRVDLYKRMDKLSTPHAKREAVERSPMIHTAWVSQSPAVAAGRGNDAWAVGSHQDLGIPMSQWMGQSHAPPTSAEVKLRILAGQTRMFV